MIEIKAKANRADENLLEVETSVGVTGCGDEIVAEAIATLRGLMKNLKETEPRIHTMVLMEIAMDSSILRGEKGKDEEEAHKSELADLMSKAIIREGEIN